MEKVFAMVGAFVVVAGMDLLTLVFIMRKITYSGGYVNAGWGCTMAWLGLYQSTQAGRLLR
jgi:hypothetical protein